MSGIAGIFNSDGRAVDTATLKRMVDVMAERGPDGAGYYSEGAVGLGVRILRATPEAAREAQPLQDETKRFALVMDGRVDNLLELIDKLEARGSSLRDDTDAEIILKAYMAWGEEFLSIVYGDFALAIWDSMERKLLCARDVFGVKPFYYYHDRNAFRFASEMRSLFEDGSVPKEPNTGMIAEYLAVAITSKEETLYKGITRLQPAHYLIVESDRVSKKKVLDVRPL